MAVSRQIYRLTDTTSEYLVVRSRFDGRWKVRVTPGLINVELWHRAYPVISSIRAKARDLIDSGAWYPRKDARMLDVFENGWPNPSRRSWQRNGPPDIKAMFGDSPGPTTPCGYSDVPELLECRAYILSRNDLVERFVPPRAADNPESRFRTMMIDDLLFNVAERCESLNIGDDKDSVSQVYSEAEKAMLADSLSCDIIVPLLLTSFAEEHIEVDNNVSIEKMSESLQLARAPHRDYSSVAGPLRSAATHAVVVRGLELQNLHPLRHVLNQYDVTKALDVVDQVLRSLRVLSGAPTGYADVYVRPKGWAYSWFEDLPPLAHVETVRKFPAEMEDGGWNSEPRPYSKDVTDAVPRIYSSLTSGNRRIAIAARRLDSSRLRDEPEDQVLDACIGLEALLGNELTEITHRLAQRAAALLRKRFPPSQIYIC